MRSWRRSGSIVAVLVLAAFLAPAREASSAPPAAPVSSLHFDAISRIEGNWPADPTGALGTTHYLTAVNTSYALYDRSGSAVLGPAPLGPLFNLPSGTLVYDPKVVYDQYEDTFVMVFLGTNDAERRSWILVAAIPDATATDTRTWCRTKIAGDQSPGDGRQWVDYPGLGYTADMVTVSTNQWSWSSDAFVHAQVLSLDKAGLYDCSQDPSYEVFAGRDTTNPDGTPAFTIQPAQTVGSGPREQYLLSFQPASGRGYVVVWRLAASGGGLVLKRAAIDVGRVEIAPFGTQGGGKVEGPGAPTTWWDPGDLRLVNAWYDADLGTVFAAHAVARDLGPDAETGGYLESVVRWYEVEPASKLRSSFVVRKGVVGEAETDAGWPVVATDAGGNLFVTYSRASAVTGEYLSAWAAEIRPGRISVTTVMLAAGEARVEVVKGYERWGDYNGIGRDPLDPSVVVMVNQYALADGGGPTRDWQQTVDLVTHG